MAKKKAKTKKNKIEGFKKLTKQLKKLVKNHGAELIISLATGIIAELIAEKTKKFIRDKATEKVNEPVPTEASAPWSISLKSTIHKSAFFKEAPEPTLPRRNTPTKLAVTPPVVKDQA